jgi:RNA polymerase sigma-70 factor (ECF subfamily)
MRFEELYHAQFDFVWRSLRRLGVPESDLADALQETFLIVYRKYEEFEGRAKVSTWLFRIAMGVARDRRQRAHVRREVLGDDCGETESARPSPEDELERTRNLDLVQRALLRLNLEQRAVFILFELEELGGEEVAEILQIPLGTVHSRLRLARAAFQRSVQGELLRRAQLFRSTPETSS